MCDREDEELSAANAVKNYVGSAANDQFANAGFNSYSAQVRTASQCFHEGYDPDREAFGGAGLIESYERSNLLQACARQRRPSEFYRHNASSSWFLPQTHLGGGSSWLVPQESSQAFMSSCLMKWPEATWRSARPISASILS